jgi:hypothetical protein
MSNEIYFTRNTKRAARGGDTLVLVTEGARVTITLQPNGQPAKITVAKAKPATAPRATVPATPATPAKVTPATKPATKPATARRTPATRAPRATARAAR